MYSLDSLRQSSRNVNDLVDIWIERLRAQPAPDWKGLDVAVGMLWRLTAIEKTIIALKKQGAKADKTYLYKLCNGITALHNFMKLVNHAPAEARRVPIPPLD